VSAVKIAGIVFIPSESGLAWARSVVGGLLLLVPKKT
jgi:hypothetical protein